MNNFFRHIVQVIRYNPLSCLALGGVCLLIFLALFGQALAPYDAFASSNSIMQPPSTGHWFGTDNVGRDIFSRVLISARLDLGIAVSAVLLSLVVGAVLGAIAGFYGGRTDRMISRFMETVMAFPLFVLAMAVVAALGNSVSNIVYATAVINLPFYVRVTRTEVNIRRHAQFVEAAMISGNSNMRIIIVHLIPNVLPTVMVQASLNMGWAILNAAGLSFIGLGVRPPDAEWGIMVAEGAQYIVSGEWWAAICPGIALMFAVLCFNLLGDALRDILDPRKRT
ncbi:MAG: ABC transporter permease [Desulfovibrio sp.]|jgi:peptide/nickel transport system permease protein|nr:ABC transporter permease [Desulfovibrio sp.]